MQATGCGPGWRPSPRCRCGPRCCRRPARSATSPRSASACAATATSGSSGSNWLHELRPQQARRPQLGDLHEEVHADRPEERQPRRERVDVQPGVDAGPQVLHAVGEGVGQLQVVGRPGLLDVVAGDGDRVELRHLPRGEREDVGDDLHRRAAAGRCRCCGP